MKLFILFFLLFANFYEKSHQDDIPCDERTSQVVPNVMRAYHSVDITKLDVFSFTDQGFCHLIFNCTVNNPRYWHNPIIPKSKFMVPDQIPRIYLDSFGEFSERVNVHKDVDTLMTSLSINAGVSVDTQAFGTYSLSGGFKIAKENILKNDRTIVEITAVVSSYEVEVVPYVLLNTSNNFQNLVDDLSDQIYENDPYYFNALINSYGTHYFSSLRLGGLVIMSTLVENSYLQTTDVTEVFAQIGVSFKKFVGVKVSLNGSDHEMTEATRNHIHQSIQVHGGNSDVSDKGLNSTEEFNEWLISVQRNPIAFGGKLVPITNLVRNAEIREQLKIAINTKLNHAFLENMEDTLKIIDQAGYHNDIWSKIKKCSAALIPNIKDVEEIKKAVEKLTKQFLITRDRVGYRNVDVFNNFEIEKMLELQVRGTISQVINSKQPSMK